MSDLQDARGCLTPAGFAAVMQARVGEVPPELAAHIASCGRCQQRLLTGGVERPAGPRREPPSLKRMFLLVGLIVFAILLFLVSLRWLTATPP